MFGLGTIINIFAIVCGGVLGTFFGKHLSKENQNALISACGLCTLFIGIAGCLEQMLKVEGPHLSSSGVMVIILSYAIGTLIGTIGKLEEKIEKFGEFLKAKANRQKRQ